MYTNDWVLRSIEMVAHDGEEDLREAMKPEVVVFFF